MATVFNANLNSTLPDVAIHIGGRERPMAFCYKAIDALESKHKQSAGWLLSQMDRLSIAAELLHAALWRDDQTLTVEQVAEWVSFHNLKTIQDALLAAWFGSVPEKQPGEAKASRKRPRNRAK
jgi:hypothetical protein